LRPALVAAADGRHLDGQARPRSIESVAAFATYPIVTLLSIVQAMQANLAALAARRGQPMGDLPCARTTMADFKQLIGWHAIEERQSRYEVGTHAA